MKILFAGCGDLARRTGSQLKGCNAEYYGLRRNSQQVPPDYIPIQADLTNSDELQVLEAYQFDYVVVTLTPAGRSLEQYQQAYVKASQGLIKALKNHPPKHVFYISSTSVYHQSQHELINETSVAEATDTGAVLRQAEQLWLTSSIPCSVLRFSGIYGRGQMHLVEQVRAGAVAPVEPHITNRIHADDGAAVIAHLINYNEAGKTLEPIYIVSDDEPVLMTDVVTWLQQQLAVVPQSDETVLKRRGGSKRLSNERLKATGFDFKYPTFRQGYLTEG